MEKVTEYGQCPNTDTLGISETINLTKKMFMNKIFKIIQIVYKSIFYFLIIQNIADISNKLIFYNVKFMKKNVNLKRSQAYIQMFDLKYNNILLKHKVF